MKRDGLHGGESFDYPNGMKSSLGYLIVGLVAVVGVGFLLRFDGGANQSPKTSQGGAVTSTKQQVPFDWKTVTHYELKANDPRETRLVFQVDLRRGSAEGYYLSGSDEGSLYGEVVTSTGEIMLTLAAPDRGERPYGTATTTWQAGILKGEVQLGAFNYELARFTPRGGASVQWRNSEKTYEPNEQTLCEFGARWPEVVAGNGVSTAVAQRVNQQLKTIVFEGKDPVKIKDEYIAGCQQELRDLEKEGLPTEDFGGAYRRMLWYTVGLTVNESGYLGLVVHQSTYSGGAHGLTGRVGVLFDLRTGNRLLLRDLVSTESLDAFWRKQLRTLLANYRDELFEETYADLESQATNKRLVASSTALALYGAKDNFFVTPGGVTFFYQQYEVAPYAVGLPEARIPFAGWTNWRTDFRLPGSENTQK